MCIAILNNGKKLTKTELENCWISNDDGGGMLFIENGKLVASKYPNNDKYGVAGESFNEMYQDYLKVYEMSSHPILLHFRIATHGFSDAYLHPFPVGDHVGLIHNGIIDGYGSKEMSDTADFAQELATLPTSMLSNLSFLDIPFIYNAIYEIIGTHNKLVFMDDSGDYVIFNEDKGHWVDKNWFSNDAYKTRITYRGNMAMYDYDSIEKKYDYDKDWWSNYRAEPYIDNEYDCTLCEGKVKVDVDACCVDCGSFIIQAESDVINKMMLEESDLPF